jgi:hypothetical protein
MNHVYGNVMRALVAFILLATTSVAAQEARRPDQNVNPTAANLADFKMRVDEYLSVRKKAKGDAPPLKQTPDPAEIRVATEALATAVRAARPDARQGDIFTPEIQMTFRHLLSPELKGQEGQHAKKVLKDDAPIGVPLKVNAKYPDGKSFPTVPANLLLNLPKLPSEVEYRIIGKNLILRDPGADLIVDFMLDAIK